MTSSTEDSEFGYELKVPKDRVAVIIGKKGEVKRQLESATRTNLNIDSKEGIVIISGKDALGMYSAREIIKAIGRGFNPEIAQLLLKQDYSFEIIDVSSISRSKNDEKRLKGRIIGESGKSRKTIEELTGAYLSVYGKTVCIIGDISSVALARKAIELLVSGAQHASVYRWLEKQRREMRKKEVLESFENA